MDEFSVEHVLRYEFLSDDLSNLLRSHNLSINEVWPVETPTERPSRGLQSRRICATFAGVSEKVLKWQCLVF